MPARWSIKKKLVFCVTLIALIVATLSVSGVISVNAYRHVVRTVSFRAAELPLAHELTSSVEQLLNDFDAIRSRHDDNQNGPIDGDESLACRDFLQSLNKVRESLHRYRAQIELVEPGTGISDNRQEMQAVDRLDGTLARIESIASARSTADFQSSGGVNLNGMSQELATLKAESAKFPGYFQKRIQDLKGNVRGQYHTLIAITWTASILSVGLLVLLVRCYYVWVVCPLRTVVDASRRVAAGDFEHHVDVGTRDEMADLAAGLNEMTMQFKRIRDDLDRQVRERTQEVVRGEQLASVGFLAAGVAHEINNPLAAIAMCAESLESRLQDIIAADDLKSEEEHNPEITVLRKYLRRIQDEAFRCKGITEKLLNYSRLGDSEKRDTELTALVEDVIDLLRTLGRYRSKRIDFQSGPPIFARVVPEEIKQVVLNLVANALDSLDQDGVVTISLRRANQSVELLVADNGCGMTDEVRRHLFQPFFTRRRDGQGTGLGLSITYRIVVDHGGTIEAHSEGPGCGSLFRVALPLNAHEERHEKHQAA